MFDVKTKYWEVHLYWIAFIFVSPVIYDITFFLVVHPIFPLNGKKQKFVVELLIYKDL